MRFAVHLLAGVDITRLLIKEHVCGRTLEGGKAIDLEILMGRIPIVDQASAPWQRRICI